MSRLLFLPNPQTLMWFESPLDAEHLLQDVRMGVWNPPEPYPPLPVERISAQRQGDVVTVVLLPTVRREARPLRKMGLSQRLTLRLLMEGLTTREIAERIGLSERTVYHHVERLKSLFGAATRAELIHAALQDAATQPRSQS